MKLLIITASDNNNLNLAKELQDISRDIFKEVNILNIVSLDIPLFTNALMKKGAPKDISSCLSQIRECDAMIVLSPEYNGGMAPALNNMIAWISVSTKHWADAFSNKACLLGTYSGSAGAHVLAAMRSQLSYLGVNVLGRSISVYKSKELDRESAKIKIENLFKLASCK